MIRKIEIVFLFLCFSPVISHSQTKTTNENIWFHYSGKNLLTQKLSLTLEGTMRYTGGLSEKQQWFIRPSLDYQFTKALAGSIGYSHYNTYVYGNPSLNKIQTPEDHFWIQGTYTQYLGASKLTHRLRDEFRYVGIAVSDPAGDGLEIGRYEYRNRLRYMFLINYPLVKKEDMTTVFAILGDEVFMNLGANAGKTFLNQNRIIGGIGYQFTRQHQVQLAYIHQHIWNFSNTLQEDNPTVRLSYITTFDFSKKKG
ncbi:DUF2490 domain-containing protein [Flavobacterium humi]|uniref:DUF2490 domain-containing protein n=1 Tax=Flavobacterium humi TaxID=2562683 RepID=A0A4Z0L703_9FLAO|nr:DUF2490 domain-containing protein [Flavobacterium humi]TGD56944.1 DUF2490 domain-containing protein [Flavobacterium humi]